MHRGVEVNSEENTNLSFDSDKASKGIASIIKTDKNII